MNLTKSKYERMLLLHHKLCSSITDSDVEIVDDLLRELNEVEKFHLFPTDPILAKANSIYKRCTDKGLTQAFRLELAKEFYIYLAKMMFSFEGATLPSREQYIKLLEYNRTEFPYELANKWGERLANTTEFKDDLFFFMIILKSAVYSLAQFKIKTGTNVFHFYMHLCNVFWGGREKS